MVMRDKLFTNWIFLETGNKVVVKLTELLTNMRKSQAWLKLVTVMFCMACMVVPQDFQNKRD